MIKITEVVMVWFGGDLIFKTYIYVFCELGPVKKKRTYTYVVAKGLIKPTQNLCAHTKVINHMIMN